MFTERAMIDRLLRIHRNAPPTAHAMADWYRDVALTDCIDVATETQVPVHVVAAAMAILSPGPQYSVNVADTRRMCQWARTGGLIPTVSTYGANRAKAADMLLAYNECEGTFDPEPYVSGPKVTAFFWNILGQWDRVTLDRHAVRPISKAGKDIPANKAERFTMESAYRKAAAKVGLRPAQFQAVIWVAVRGAAA